jgi:hypothetical protein
MQSKGNQIMENNWREENLKRLQQAEEKAYARRTEAENLIEKLIGEEMNNSLFFVLRQAFSEYEDAEERCVKTTDRLTEFQYLKDRSEI